MSRIRTLAAAAAAIGAATLTAGAAFTQAPPVKADDIVMKAKSISYRLRTGRYDLAPEAVTLLEAAVQANPNDTRLWNELGTAYFQQLTAGMNGVIRIDFPAVLKNAAAAHKHALDLNPNDPEALAGHGTALAISSQFTRDPEMARQGMAEMDRAVALAPSANIVRLQRGFTQLGVGPGNWNAAAAEEDLKFLIKRTEGSKPADVMHVLLGDLYGDMGKPDLARAQYAVAARAGSAMRETAEKRLADFAGAGVAPADKAKLRGGTGNNCAMCHGG